MQLHETSNKVEGIIAQIAQIDPGFNHDQDLYSEVGIESINSLAILLTLEEQFNIQIEDTDFVKSRTVHTLSGLINKLTTSELLQ